MQQVMPLTKRQKEVLDFVSNFIAKNGYSPSLQEVADFLKTENVSTAQYFIEELENKGHLKRRSNVARGITTTSPRTTIPLLGVIAAGELIEPIENPGNVSVPDNLEVDSRHPHYALKVKGDSMMDMGVLDGDTVLVRHQLTAKDGDVVVAITEMGATLKIFRNENNKIYLQPRNKNFQNIYPKSLEIRGKFVGLVRKG